MYNLYNVYMNISEFRKDLRKAFELAKQHPVEIDRYGETFELHYGPSIVRWREVPDSPSTADSPSISPSTRGTMPIIKTVEQAKAVVKGDGVCEHGRAIGFCKIDKCNRKYHLKGVI